MNIPEIASYISAAFAVAAAILWQWSATAAWIPGEFHFRIRRVPRRLIGGPPVVERATPPEEAVSPEFDLFARRMRVQARRNAYAAAAASVSALAQAAALAWVRFIVPPS